jgi:hypothetical protein
LSSPAASTATPGCTIRGPASKWFRDAIKDEELAAEVASIERDETLSARDSRSRVKEVVERRYTAPAKKK